MKTRVVWWVEHLLTHSLTCESKSGISLLDTKQCTKSEQQPFIPRPLVTVGVAGISVPSQRPQKHAVGSIKYVRRRMPQCYTSEKNVLSQKNTVNKHTNQVEHLFLLSELSSLHVKEKYIYIYILEQTVFFNINKIYTYKCFMWCYLYDEYFTNEYETTAMKNLVFWCVNFCYGFLLNIFHNFMINL